MTRPHVQASSRFGVSRTGLDPAERPMDRLLTRLAVHGLPHREDLNRDDTTITVCPLCVNGWDLRVRERGRGGVGDLTIRCANGCDPAEISAHLERDPADLRIEQAERRELDVWRLLEETRAIAARALEQLMTASRGVAA
jgi:hypothetical protein